MGTANPDRNASVFRCASTSRGFGPNGRARSKNFQFPGAWRCPLPHQHRLTLPPLPPPHIRAGVTVRQRGLAQDRMLKGDRLLFVRFGQQARRFNQPFLNQRLRFRQRQHTLGRACETSSPSSVSLSLPLIRSASAAPFDDRGCRANHRAASGAEPGSAQLSPKRLCIRHLSTATLGAKTTANWGRSGTANLGHNPIIEYL